MGQKQSSIESTFWIAFALLVGFVLFKMGTFVYSATFPSFEVSDCIKQNPDKKAEAWETFVPNHYRVLQTGRKSYRLEYLTPDFMVGREITLSFVYINNHYSKTVCPAGE